MTAKEKAKELIGKISTRTLFIGGKETIRVANLICDEVMDAVVKHGQKWHEYNEIKNELLKI